MATTPRAILAVLLCGVLGAGCKSRVTDSGTNPDTATTQTPAQYTVPSGFQLAVYADNVTNARSMALGTGGTLFVGSRTAGRIHAIIDSNNDHRADRVVLIAQGLDQPNGIALRNGALYVATANQLLRYDDIENRIDSPPASVVVRDGLPNPSAGHTWKFIAFGPDDLLYMSIGSTCNVCSVVPSTASIVRMKPDGSGLEVFAEGVRNSVGFDWHPDTHELWFTDNGRDNMGDDVPDDELNVAWKGGMHFGFPFCHQGDVADPQFGAQRACSTTEPPVQKLGAHVAAIGMSFYTGSMFPPSYMNAVIIAQHGSWNRTVPSGYRVMVARTDGRRVTGYELLARSGTTSIGRPADVLQMPDGSLLISDDTGNRIWRVTYAAP
jgi:glucose/arabinose dehydrogenase